MSQALITFRTFRNSDPPRLAELWRSQPPQRGLMQPLSAGLFERMVLSKPYFDRDGLILAVAEERIVGFVHAGFAATADGSAPNREQGIINLLMIHPSEADAEVGSQLVTRAEEYLRERGAKVLWGAGAYPAAPFYFGLYGGSQQSGVLATDPILGELLVSRGYRPVTRSRIFQRELATFRPEIDRRQMQIRRTTTVQTICDPPCESWWQACLFDSFDRVRYDLIGRDAGPPLASVTFWNMESFSAAWGVVAAGLIELEVTTTQKRHGLATFLVSEAFRHLHTGGTALVEIHVAEENIATLRLTEKLGFTEVDEATLYRKD